MIRAFRAVLTVVGLGGKAALSLTGVAVVLGAMSGLPEATDPLPPPSSKVGGEPDGRTILRIPEGEFTKGLTVVDPSGRELFTLNSFRDGAMIVATGESIPVHVGVWTAGDGRVSFVMHGTTWETRLQAGPDEVPEAKVTSIASGTVVGRLGPSEE